MSTYINSWAFTKAGDSVSLDEGIFTRDYDFYTALDGRRGTLSGLTSHIVPDDKCQRFLKEDAIWLEDPAYPKYGMYSPRVVDAGSRRLEFDTYGPPHIIETCIDQGGLLADFFDYMGDGVSWVTLEQLMKYDWHQHCVDRTGKSTTVFNCMASGALFERLDRLEKLNAFYILYQYT